MKNKKGFTLIELLVVIAIIGLLSTLAVVSLSAARERARDAKRLADLRNIQGAMEIYASEQGVYPVYASATELNENCLDGSKGPEETPITTPCIRNLMSIPKDPVGSSYNFKYCSNSNGTQYRIWAGMESKDGVCALAGEVQENIKEEGCPCPM